MVHDAVAIKENVIWRRRFRIHKLLHFVFEDCQAKRYDIVFDGSNSP